MAASRDDIKFLSNPNIGRNRKKYCRFRKFGIKYAALHPDYEQVRDAYVKVKCRDDWEAVLRKWYSADRPGQYPDAGIHRAQGSGVTS